MSEIFGGGRAFRVWSLGFLILSSACASSPGTSHQHATQLFENRATPPPNDDGRQLFAESQTLELEPLLAAVLARNPDIERARMAWRAALARYPQATEFKDPTVAYTLAPLSIVSDEVDFGHSVTLSQPLPYPGKRRLRGQVALAEAEAAQHDYGAARLRLALMASYLYHDLGMTGRALLINDDYIKELTAHRDALSAHLATGHAWQDATLKVLVDLSQMQRERIELNATRDVIVAQLNELLHREPDLPLPLPPTQVEAPPRPEPVAAAQDLARRNRPELKAMTARHAGAEAGVELAQRSFYPDFRVTGTYNSMWPRIEHELMVGIAVDLPVWRATRHAAVDEATARRLQIDAARAGTADQIAGEVATAHRRLLAALDVVASYRDDILPAARNRAQSVRVGLDSGRVTFIEVLSADHLQLTAQLGYERALTDALRRKAELEHATGELTQESER